MDEPLGLNQLLALARAFPAPSGTFDPLGTASFLHVRVESLDRLAAPDFDRLAGWLQRLPCPSLALVPAGHALAAGFDVVSDQPGELERVIAMIRRSPLAACVLVQLLRATEDLAVPAALACESLAYSTLQAGPEFRRWRDQTRPQAPAPAETGPAILLDRHGTALTLTLNRPGNRNAVTIEMRDALTEALDLVLADPEIRSVTLRGAGRCFSVGGDLREFGTAPDPAVAHAIRSVRMPAGRLALCGERLTARIHGACIGSGLELPAFATRIVASPNSFFQLPEVGYGLIPASGGCVALPRRIGRQRTALLALSGRRLSARTALAWGLVDAIESG
jgi:enoyl-CoA hydratase